MSQQYYTLVTNIGAARIAKATALGTVVNLSQMAVGDGGGNPITPSATATALTREVYRSSLNMLEVDENNQKQVIAELLIPEEQGDFTIREVGLFDDDNNLIAIGSIADSYKPLLSSGTASQQIIRMVIQIDNTDAVVLKVDPAVVLATRDFVTKEVSRIMENSVARVDSIDSLRAYNGTSPTVIVEEYYKNGSLAAGLFFRDINGQKYSDNGGTVIVGAKGARWRAIGQNVIVQTGMISDGGTIPLPEGYTQEQCRWIVSMREDNPRNESWDIDEGGSHNHFYYKIYADENRLVTAKMHRKSYPLRSINVNYMIIGVK
nr:MAG TPA: tail collar fiber protein [Bacteriophage sp.]